MNLVDTLEVNVQSSIKSVKTTNANGYKAGITEEPSNEVSSIKINECDALGHHDDVNILSDSASEERNQKENNNIEWEEHIERAKIARETVKKMSPQEFMEYYNTTLSKHMPISDSDEDECDCDDYILGSEDEAGWIFPSCCRKRRH